MDFWWQSICQISPEKDGALRRGPPFHGSRSLRDFLFRMRAVKWVVAKEIKPLLSAGKSAVAKLKGDNLASQSSMELYYPRISGPPEALRFLKIGLKCVTGNFTRFFAKREICHLELTLGASSPKKRPNEFGQSKCSQGIWQRASRYEKQIRRASQIQDSPGFPTLSIF